MRRLKIGIVKETKDGEKRVSCTPTGVATFCSNGHEVYIETQAGIGSSYSDKMYQLAGAVILKNAKAIFRQATLIYKVKEIELAEYPFLHQDHIILSFLHTNSNITETEALLQSKCISIAYEDITDANGGYPILEPMSDLAGKIGFIESLNLMKVTQGGSGLLLSQLKDICPPEIVIFGAGHAARGAAKLAASFGNQVTLLGRGAKNLAIAKEQLPANAKCLIASRQQLVESCGKADVIINCVLWSKNRQGHLLTNTDLELLQPHCLIIDVACDNQGAIESCRPTSISNPTYQVAGRTHFCVDNLPAYYAATATDVLCQTTLPYILEIANKGIDQVLLNNLNIRQGLTTYKGLLTLEETALKHNYTYTVMTTDKLN